MFKFKAANPYWQEFSSYQTFESVDELIFQIDTFMATYDLTPKVKAVLNTLKLHSKRFIGVCWLYRDEIAKKAGVSLSSVKRAIKGLRETGILTVHEHIHTKRGGKTHNVYVINPIFEPTEEPSNEPSLEVQNEPVKPVVASDSAVSSETHKNTHTNSNKTLKDISIEIENDLSDVPNEFVEIMLPFYANSPDIIRARWKTVCVAAKHFCGDISNASWYTIKECWLDTVRRYKQRKIKNATDDGLGGYFYGVLKDYLPFEFLKCGVR